MNIFRKVMARILSEAYITIPTISNSTSEDFESMDMDTWVYGNEDLPCNEFLAITLMPTGAWGARDGSSLEIWVGMEGYRCNDLILGFELNGNKTNEYTWTTLKAVLSTPDDEVSASNLLGMQSSDPNHWLIPRVHVEGSIRGISAPLTWVDHF